jgi:hypothetical protein
MTLPVSRNTTYAPNAQVKSLDLNAIQDEIIRLYGRTQSIDWLNWDVINPKLFNDSIDGGGGPGKLLSLGFKSNGTAGDYSLVGVTAAQLLATRKGKFWEVDASTNIAAFSPQNSPRATAYVPAIGMWVTLGSSASGPEILTSAAGITGATWDTRNDPAAAANRTCVATGSGMPIAIISRDAGGFLSSPDGITWTERTHPATSKVVRSVVWGADVFVAVGNTVVVTSPDGITWTDRTANIPGPLAAIDWADVAYDASLDLFVAVGKGSGFMTSPDGVTWTQRTAPGTIASGKPATVTTDGAGTIYVMGHVPEIQLTFSASDMAVLFRSIDAGVTWERTPLDWVDTCSGVLYFGGRLIAFGAAWYQPVPTEETFVIGFSLQKQA